MSLVPLDFAMLRTTLHPFDALESLLSNQGSFAEALADFFSDPATRDSLVYMAPGFYDLIEARLVNRTLSEDDIGALLRYAIRICSRPTPLGWSASCSVLPTADGALPTIAPITDGKVALDASVRYKVVNSQQAAASTELTWCANDTLWFNANSLRFIKLEKPAGGNFVSKLSNVQLTAYVDAILSKAKSPTTSDQLANHLLQAFPEDEFTLEEGCAFVKAMQDGQLLTTDHLLALSTRSFEEKDFDSRHRELIDQLSLLAEQCGRPDGNLSDYLRMAKSQIDELVPGQSKKAIFDITAWRDLDREAGIPRALLVEMSKCVDALSRTAVESESKFSGLIDRWDRVFGDADVPLLRLTDEIVGIYGGVDVPSNTIIPVLPEPAARLSTESESGVRETIMSAIAGNSAEVVLPLAKLLKLKASIKLPPVITAWFKIWCVHGSDEQVLELTGASTWPAGRLFGRFSSHDERFKDMLVKTSESFLTEDTIVAELVHNTRERISNICQRPTLSKYEIGIRTGVGATATAIALSDLLVCRVGKRLRLRSESLGKWVHLNFSTAHNHSLPSNLRVYKFLIDIVEQDSLNLASLSSRTFCRDTIYAPRVRLGNVIVGRASWRILGQLRDRLLKADFPSATQEIVLELRQLYSMPRWVSVVDGDNHLALDLENEFCLKELVDSLRKSTTLTLIECTPDAMKPGLTGVGGHYHHELLVAFDTGVRPAFPASPSQRAIAVDAAGQASTSFGPGSEWLYLKIYAHPKQQNKLLSHLYHNVIAPLQVQKIMQDWFFIRYSDGDGNHIRLRLKSNGANALTEIYPHFQVVLEQCKRLGLIRNLIIDTYATEMIRYGGSQTMPLVHRSFTACSEAAIHFMSVITPDAHAGMVVDMIGIMLDCFGMPSSRARVQFSSSTARAYSQEYGFSKDTRKDVSVLAKKLMDREAKLIHQDEHALVLSTLKDACVKLGRGLKNAAAESGLSQPLDEIYRSVLHMQFNRLFVENPRAQEAVCWDVIRRLDEYEARNTVNDRLPTVESNR